MTSPISARVEEKSLARYLPPPFPVPRLCSYHFEFTPEPPQHMQLEFLGGSSVLRSPHLGPYRHTMAAFGALSLCPCSPLPRPRTIYCCSGTPKVLGTFFFLFFEIELQILLLVAMLSSCSREGCRKKLEDRLVIAYRTDLMEFWQVLELSLTILSGLFLLRLETC